MFTSIGRQAWLWSAVVLLAAPYTLRADYILLKNGNRVRGEVIESTDEGIRVQMPSGVGFIPHIKIKTIAKEDPKTYFKSEAQSFLERGLYSQVVKFAKQGKERFPDLTMLDDIGEAGQKMLEAYAKAGEMEFEAAIALAEAALAKAETSKKLRLALKALKADLAYYKEHGSLPGEFRQLSGERSVVLHHHHKLARAWSTKLEAAIERQWTRLRRNKHNKIPKDSRLVLKVYRDAAAFTQAVGEATRRPRTIIPTTDQARMVSPTSAATHMAEATGQLEAVAARYVARQLNADAPLWMIEGMVHTSTRKAAGDAGSTEKHLEAFRKLLDGGKLLKLEKLMAVRNYGQLQTQAKRDQYMRQSAMLLRFLTGWKGGATTLTRALSSARTAMSLDLLKFITGKLRIPKGVSLQFDDLMPVYLATTLTRGFRFKTLDDLEKSYLHYLRSGKHKRNVK